MLLEIWLSPYVIRIHPLDQISALHGIRSKKWNTKHSFASFTESLQWAIMRGHRIWYAGWWWQIFKPVSDMEYILTVVNPSVLDSCHSDVFCFWGGSSIWDLMRKRGDITVENKNMVDETYTRVSQGCFFLTLALFLNSDKFFKDTTWSWNSFLFTRKYCVSPWRLIDMLTLQL